MKTKLYANELLRKLLSEDELEILEKIWDSQLSTKEKIHHLVGDE
ncbi:MAG: hypothetical protein ACOWW1_00385 [archaeon]